MSKGRSDIVIVAEDASKGSKKKLYNMSTSKNIEVIECFTKSELGKAVGKDSVSAISINNKDFAKGITNSKPRRTKWGKE